MALYVPSRPVRFVTAASLFDGHDAAITIMRRILQAQGCEVIHLGHDRSVADVVDAAVQEDAQGVAISSYQGGHLEYFGYLVDLLRERGAGHVRVYGGGGGGLVAGGGRPPAARGGPGFTPPGGGGPGPPRPGQKNVPGGGNAGAPREGTIRWPRRATPPSPRRPPPSTPCSPVTTSRSPARSPWSSRVARRSSRPRCERRPRLARCRCSVSPAPEGRARARSPTSSSAGSARTRRTSSASPSSPSTRVGAAAGARCSGTASA